MIRLSVIALDGQPASLCVKEIRTIDGEKYNATAPAPELTELVNRIKILEAIVQPLVDMMTTRPPETPAPEPPLPPEKEDQSDG